MNSILDAEKALKENIRKIEFENPQNLDKKKNEKQFEDIRQNKLLVIEHAKKNIDNPNHLFEFLKELQTQNQTEPTLVLAPNIYEKVIALEELRNKQETLEVHIKVLEEEKQALKNRKKDLPVDQQTVLINLNKEYQNLKTPDFLSDSNSLDRLLNDITSVIVDIALLSKNPTFIDTAFNLLKKYVSNPTFLLDLSESLTKKQE